MTCFNNIPVCLLALATLTLSACGPQSEDPAASADVTRGAALYAQNCAACHGPQARGAGPESLGIGRLPPGLTGLSRANGGVFPRDAVLGAIDGYSRRADLDDPMPLFGDGHMGPILMVEENGISTPIPSDLLALANYLETLQEP